MIEREEGVSWFEGKERLFSGKEESDANSDVKLSLASGDTLRQNRKMTANEGEVCHFEVGCRFSARNPSNTPRGELTSLVIRITSTLPTSKGPPPQRLPPPAADSMIVGERMQGKTNCNRSAI